MIDACIPILSLSDYYTQSSMSKSITCMYYCIYKYDEGFAYKAQYNT
jgi:hypothetical protein